MKRLLTILSAVAGMLVHGGCSSRTSSADLTSAQTTITSDRVAQLSKECRDPPAGRAKNKNAVVEFEGYLDGPFVDPKANEEDIQRKRSDQGYEFFNLWLKPSIESEASLVCDLDAQQVAIVRTWRVGSKVRVKGLFNTCDGAGNGLIFLRPCIAL
jgi:outer membrane murein-binding lipoprotein Lpp